MHVGRLKTTSLSLLVLGALLVVSAPAAEGHWVILVSKNAKTSVSFHGAIESARLLVAGLNLEIKCTKGEFAGSASLNALHDKLTGSGEIAMTGCLILHF